MRLKASFPQTDCPTKWGESEEKALLALARVTNLRLKAHVPKHLFFLGYHSKDRRQAKKALRRLVKLGLVAKHPTAGEMTYQLTKRGLTTVWKFEQDFETNYSQKTLLVPEQQI